eukprot:SAG31_NODE_4186_length_3492_cov_1.799587_4_plen_36_part_00
MNGEAACAEVVRLGVASPGKIAVGGRERLLLLQPR